MKTLACWLGMGLIVLGSNPLFAAGKPGGVAEAAPGTPQFSATFSKLFGEHKAFSATMVTEVTKRDGADTFTTPCKVAFSQGKSRMEVDVARSKGSRLPAGMTDQLKAMGMGEVVVLGNQAGNTAHLIYPGLQSYAVISSPNEKPISEESIKVDVTELGKETIDGHPCIRNKVVLTAPGLRPEEAMVWNATDLKKFPIRIETSDETAKAVMTFSELKFEKPGDALFEPPANYTKYTSVEALMQGAIMKRLHGGGMTPLPQ